MRCGYLLSVMVLVCCVCAAADSLDDAMWSGGVEAVTAMEAQVVPELCRKLPTTPPFEARTTLRALAFFGDPASRQALLEHLDRLSPYADYGARVQAQLTLQALEKVSDAATETKLLELMNLPQPERPDRERNLLHVQIAAAASLGRCATGPTRQTALAYLLSLRESYEPQYEVQPALDQALWAFPEDDRAYTYSLKHAIAQGRLDALRDDAATLDALLASTDDTEQLHMLTWEHIAGMPGDAPKQTDWEYVLSWYQYYGYSDEFPTRFPHLYGLLRALPQADKQVYAAKYPRIAELLAEVRFW